jgi:hypothetical protein
MDFRLSVIYQPGLGSKMEAGLDVIFPIAVAVALVVAAFVPSRGSFRRPGERKSAIHTGIAVSMCCGEISGQ